jgi:hypothetical protein
LKNNPATAGVQTIYSTLRPTANAKTPAATTFLTEAQVAPIVAQAGQFWASMLGAEAAAKLDGLRVVIGDLPQGKLGALTNGYIVIDGTAAGRGWFVDPTPQDSSEFAARRGSGRLVATSSGAAHGRVDLLTVVLHEMGHALGQDHEAGGMMAEMLNLGERQSPDAVPAVAHPTAPPAAKAVKGGWFLSRFYRR